MSNHQQVQRTTSPIPWWLYAVVIVGALLMATGAVIALISPAMLAPPGQAINQAVHVYAGYLVSRNLAIAVMLLTTLTMRSRTALCTLMVLTAIIQFIDAGLDIFEARWMVAPGVFVLGVLFLIGARRLAKSTSPKPAP